jgi:hypothetical protein
MRIITVRRNYKILLIEKILSEHLHIIKHFQSWEVDLTRRQKKYIHFWSMYNFAFHLESLPLAKQEKAVQILEHYIGEVESNYCNYSVRDTYELVSKYMNKLEDIYQPYVNFRLFLKPIYLIILSLLGDFGFYFLLRTNLGFYVPVISITSTIYYLYCKFYLGKKKLLYGIFY